MIKRPCRFYSATGECRLGEHCKFLHNTSINTTCTSSDIETNLFSKNGSVDVVRDQNRKLADDSSKGLSDSKKSTENEGLNKVEKLQVSGQQQRKICRLYSSTHSCHYGDRCKYQHILSADAQRVEADAELVQDNRISRTTPLNTTSSKNGSSNSDDIQRKQQLEKVCRFYSRGFCHFGAKCKFSHPSTTCVGQPSTKPALEALEETATLPADRVQKEVVTRVARVPQVLHVIKREEVDTKKQRELRETELKQLKCRFPSDKLKILSVTDELAAFIFTFVPSDPDWPFDVRSFDIQVNFDGQYPLKLFSVDVPLDQDLPATVQRYLKATLQEWVVKKEEENVKKGIVELLFRPFLRWLDRNMESIVTEGLKQLRRELTAKAAGLQFISAEELQRETDHQPSADIDQQEGCPKVETVDGSEQPVPYRKFDHELEGVYTGPTPDSHTAALEHMPNTVQDDSSDSDADSDDSTSKDATAEEGEKLHQRPHIDPDTERIGTEMSFRNMQLWSCTTVLLEKLRLTVQCERCKNMTDFNTPPNRVNSIACSKCNHTQLVVYRPLLAHSYSSTFGYLDLEGCLAFDLILKDCHFSLGCNKCSRDILVKSCIPGRVMEIRCRGCHTTMKFAVDSVKLTTLTSDGVDSSKFSGKIYTVRVRKNQRVAKDPAIQEGKPLPDSGTCKHYKKSYRWLRFPCCGKTYPCDICHDSKEDHEMKFANRMICGFCCREQPYAADKPCTGCSSALAKVRTAHWEGGHGCRDKITMSRNENRKYTNLHKTVSNKAKAQQEKQKGKKNTKLRHT